MARSRKPGNAGSGHNGTPLLYTDQRKQTYEFANMRRTVRTGAATEKLTNREIMERRQFESGIGGNSVSQRDYLRRAELAEEARRHHIELECATWERIKAHHQQIIDKARETKSPVPRVLPHPDDILIDWDNGVRLLGPMTEAQWKLYDGQVKFRDALFLQQAMEDADGSVRVGDRPTIGSALLFATLTNTQLPPSLRMSDYEWMDRVERLSRLSRREALKQCRAAWRAAGGRTARGKRLGTPEKLKPMLTAIWDLAGALLAQDDDPLGYEEAVLAATDAINAFAASAPKVMATKADTPEQEESLA